MTNFRNLLETLASTRTRLETPAQVLQAIKEYEGADEIMNADFNHIKEQASYRFRDAFNISRQMLLAIEDRQDWWDELYWAFPSTFTQLNKFKKALAKCEDSKIKAAAENELTVWEEIANGMKALKPKVVKAAKKREEAKAKAQMEFSAKKQASGAMISLLEKHRKEYITEANKKAKAYLKMKLKDLAAKDWDLNELVPNNARSEGARQERAFYLSITEDDAAKNPNFYTRTGPNFRKASKQQEKKWLDLQARGAEMNYDSFINKMVVKVGEPCVEADLKGSIWTNAVLTVTTESGEQQVWKTKIILNFSKFGKMFNQFPTRKMKK